MKNYTYLLGAGASYNALPVTTNFSKKLKDFKNWFEIKYTKLSDEPYEDSQDIKLSPKVCKQIFIEKINLVIKKIDEIGSIDKYAKSLYEKKCINKLKMLKATLSCYFTFEQSRIKIDERYLDFLKKIIIQDKGDIKLPENFKIISWNYDIQFEKAFYEYCKLFNYESYTENHVNLLKKIQAYPNQIMDAPYNLNEFSILKINGCACFNLDVNSDIARTKSNYLFDYFNELKENAASNYLEIFGKHISGVLESQLNFAFENNQYTEKYHNVAKKLVEKTDTLIIIGYSFPEYNNDVDTSILNSMPCLKDIIIQTQEKDFNNYTNKLKKLLNKNEIIYNKIEETDKFYIHHN